MNLPMKKILKPDAVKTVFGENHPPTKGQKQDALGVGSSSSLGFNSLPLAKQFRKQSRAG